ncbi:hypothetical protein Thimo_3411 [Thioflavicoccus mobilis 8321]|uniref:Uncharacterized protein n=1 Tax=Thioflavicoccus mobilis 8321 TaxID=765912 RepID=L0H3B6_9GAMM|nr:hypothetical protein [Thioflavicoccus mobilis]AGA92079.1 hypothetical protein Thimo_3411 [Thioflavicoccus mobilis 8321]
MKTITLKVDDRLLDAAQARAQAEHSSLDEQFRLWLEDYVQHRQQMDRYDRLMTELHGKVRIGRKLSRDELNER